MIRAEIGGWTRDGQVRQTAYKGIEAGRDPHDVVKELAVATTTAVRDAEAAEPEPPKDEEPPMSSKAKRPAGSNATRPAGSNAKPASMPEASPATAEELAALDALGKEGVWQIGGRDLKLTNLDKTLFEGRAGDADDGTSESAHHEARTDPLLHVRRAHDAAPPVGPAAEPATGSRTALPRRASGRRTSRDGAEVAQAMA